MLMQIGPLNMHNAALKLTAGAPAQLLKAGKPQIAFAGRSNVGKSSLVNCLLGRKKLARVSGAPGKTITVNYYDIDGKLFFVDLPGYGYAKRSFADKKRWSALTQSYFEENAALAAVLQLIDIRTGVTADDADMLAWLRYYEVPHMLVATKCDKLGKTALSEAAVQLVRSPAVAPGTGCVLFSSLRGEGRDALWTHITKLAFGGEGKD